MDNTRKKTHIMHRLKAFTARKKDSKNQRPIQDIVKELPIILVPRSVDIEFYSKLWMLVQEKKKKDNARKRDELRLEMFKKTSPDQIDPTNSEK